MKKYLVIGGIAAIAIVLTLVMGKMFLNHFEKSIRSDEREKIGLALAKDKAEKEGRVIQDVEKKKEILRSVSPDELVNYFRTGRLPERKGDNKGGAP